MDALIQSSVFVALTLSIALLTWRHCRHAPRSSDGAKEYFLAGSGLSWVFVAGSITLTNINTDTLVGWNGNQMLMVVWWELAGVAGLLVLGRFFIPVYYAYKCTTVTELLERRYSDKHVRATVATLFLLGNLFIFLPIMLYTSSLFLKSMLGLPETIAGIDTLMVLATSAAVVGAAYAIFGGLRAVAVSDTYSGVLVFGLAFVIVFVALRAVGWDLSDLPPERLSMIGGADSPVPWTTLFTGMIFAQTYYFSTNQTITQRALASPTVREAQRGAYAAAVIRLFLVPPIVVVPGLCAYKLYGATGDATYGRIVGELLPHWMQGAFAAAMIAAAMTSFNSVLNSSAALYVCDLHQRYVNPEPAIARLSVGLQIAFSILAIALVPAYRGAESIIQLIQQLIGLFSMPILSAFITGLLFRNVDGRAVIATLLFGACLYGTFTFAWSPLHFLHLMFVTVWACVAFALTLNRLVFGRRATFVLADPASRARIRDILSGRAAPHRA
jgi:SSS family solute:Na+ symporter